MVSYTDSIVANSSKMGCASSSPLVESGKNLVETAKDQAGEVVAKGEKTLQDVGDKISTEVGNVKDAVRTAISTAENSIGSVIGKVGNNVESATNDVKATVNNMEEDAEEALNVASDSANEAISDAETVLASEAESAKEMISSTANEAFEKVESTKEEVEDKVKEMKESVENSLHVEDMEQHFDGLGDSVKEVTQKVEEIVTKLPTPPTSPMKEFQKEEVPPTFWEAAADAIHQKSFYASEERIEVSETTTENNLVIDQTHLNEEKEKLNKELLYSGQHVNEKTC